MCPLLPSLQQLLGEVEELAGAGSGARQAQYSHVTEITLPLLCSYVSRWWQHGPEGQLESPVCTSLTSQHASTLLGNILRIIHNHLGTGQGDWMKRLAGSPILLSFPSASTVHPKDDILVVITALPVVFSSYVCLIASISHYYSLFVAP